MKVNKQSKLAVAVQAAFVLGISGQATANQEIEKITVTANRSAQDAFEVLASQVVIDREQIEQIQPDSTLDLLRTVAGFDFTQQGGFGQQSSVFIRGANANHTLVLVDGLRVGSATLGTTELQSISPAMIEKIEIVKGPRAALWGSDAIGGVIQIFTRKLEGNEITAEIIAGTEGHRQIQAAFGFTHGNGGTTISFNKQEADGFDVLATAEDDKDGYDYASFSLRGEQTLSESLELNWQFAKNKNNTEYDNAWGGNNQAESDNYVWSLGANVAHNFAGYEHLTTITAGQNQDSNRNFRADGATAETVFETNRNQLSVVNTTRLDESLSVVTGVDFAAEEIESTTEYVDAERNVFGLFAQVGAELGNVNLEAALRFDDVEGVDSETSYNFGAGYEVTEQSRVVLTHGTGFKTPTFNDLYFPADAYSAGNPDLKSERSTTTELVYEQGFEFGKLALSVYESEIENLIEWAPDQNFFYQPRNVSAADIKGGEIALTYTGQYVTHNVNYAYVEAVNATTNEQLIRRSKHHFNYTAAAQVAGADVYVEYAYKGDAYDIGYDENFNQVRITLPSYGLLSATVAYPLNDNFTVKVRVSNALDKEYSTANNYNAQGRTAYIGVSYEM